MAYVADLHIHSRFSRACSQQLNIPNLVEWAKYKGLNLLGTGDFLHPLWLMELKSQLKEDGSGFLYKGNGENGGDEQSSSSNKGVRFILTVEIASMYSHKGSGRRIHNLVFLPSFEAAEKFQKALLAKRATLASDGRPIVGIPSKELLQMALEASEKAIFIPSHAWTPWFGIFGSESGYDSLEECFEDLADKVYGIETGLSSDPAMNWRISELDNRSILSFSDAHSLPNLGREATVIDMEEFTYDNFWKAIAQQPFVIPANAGIQLTKSGSELDPRLRGDDKIIGTIEFYPEEGKYHYTGHRNCNVRYTPEETRVKGTICPKCGRGLTVGVMERVEKLAGRKIGEIGIIRDDKGIVKSLNFPRPGYRKLVPLLQIIAEAFGTAPTSQKVINEYKKIVTILGEEIKVLTKVDTQEIAKLAGPKVAEGVDRVRKGELVIDPGYDGVYGVVKIWNGRESGQEEVKVETPQLGLFD